MAKKIKLLRGQGELRTDDQHNLLVSMAEGAQGVFTDAVSQAGTSAAQLVGTQAGRKVLIITNQHATATVAVSTLQGTSTSMTNGRVLQPGQSVSLPGYTGPVHAIASAANTPVHVFSSGPAF